MRQRVTAFLVFSAALAVAHPLAAQSGYEQLVLEQCRQALDRGEAQLAVVFCESAVRKAPQSEAALRALAEAYNATGQPDRAATANQFADQLAATSPKAVTTTGPSKAAKPVAAEEVAKPKPSNVTHVLPTATPQPSPSQPADPQPAQITRPGYWLQLGAFRELSVAEAESKRLAKSFPSLLGDLEIIVNTRDIEGRGTFHRLRAGPLADEKLASNRCGMLKTQGQDCFVAP